MATNSNIEWTDATWNPLAGCKEVSPGCTNCYAAVMAHRLEAMGQDKYKDTTHKLANGKVVWTGKISLDESALSKPLRRRTPTTYFVNSMSDLFHEDVPDEFIDKVFAVMALCPQHTFQVLTKRAEMMQAHLSAPDFPNRIYRQVSRWLDEGDSGFLGCGWRRSHEQATSDTTDGSPIFDWVQWRIPLPNVWIGVSVEDQQRADDRIPLLLQTPAAVRFLSCEPLLERICLQSVPCNQNHQDDYSSTLGVHLRDANGVGLDWVIVGGASGPGARPCDIAWIRSIVQQCRAAGVACFVKQLGSVAINTNASEMAGAKRHDSCEARVNWQYRFADKKGAAPSEWPEDLRVREFPKTAGA